MMNMIEELDRTIQSSLLKVTISIDNLNETMKAILQEMKNNE
mgnify:FL=1|tara:strand:+ start:4153 stop:4278 length:126 start_codon:yes stop_codon:yes gene_type:complete